MSFIYRHKTRFILRVFRSIYMSILPRKYLEKSIQDLIKNRATFNNTDGMLMASGRSAISFILKNDNNVKSIIIPDYNCNVVEQSAKILEGRNIFYYSVNDSYQFCIDEIIDYIIRFPDSAVIIPSYLNRPIDYKKLIYAIRAVSKNCLILFDECQNTIDLSRFPCIDSRTYIVFSFNNKTTFGLLGGLIIGTKASICNLSDNILTKNSLFEETIMYFAFLRLVLNEIREGISGKFSIPKQIEISSCKGKYSIIPKRAYRISLSTAYMSQKNIAWANDCIDHNFKILIDFLNENNIEPVSGYTYSRMPYLPVTNITKYFGDLPLKGPYGCDNSAVESYNRHYSLLFSNHFKIKRKK